MWIDSGISHTRQTRQKSRLVISLLLILLLIALFSSFIVPILMAGIFSLALEPFVSRMVKPHANRRTSSLVLLAGLFSLVMIPILLISVSFYSELNAVDSGGISKSNYSQFFTDTREHFTAWINEKLPHWNTALSVHGDQLFDRMVEKTYEALTEVVSGLMAGLPSFLLSLFVFSVALFFFISQSRKIKHFLLSLHLFARSDFDFVLKALKKSSSVILLSSVVIGIAQACLITSASLIFQIGKPGIVFGSTFLLSFVPIIGTVPVSLCLIGMALLNHHVGVVLGFTAFALFSSALDQVIRTLWMSEMSAIHPVIAFVSLLGALHIFGISGLFFGPLIVGITGQILPKFIREKSKPPRHETHMPMAIPKESTKEEPQEHWYN